MIDPTWRDHAACRTVDPDTFFPDKSDIDGALKAKEICDGCSVVEQCLTYALRTKQDHGIWGGTNETARKKLGPDNRGCRQFLAPVPRGYRYCDTCGPERASKAKHATNANRPSRAAAA